MLDCKMRAVYFYGFPAGGMDPFEPIVGINSYPCNGLGPGRAGFVLRMAGNSAEISLDSIRRGYKATPDDDKYPA